MPQTTQSSQSAESSGSLNIESVKTEDNSLYNEQVEYIAQMAESMLQKLHKPKENCLEEKPKLDPKIVVDEIKSKLLPIDEPVPGPSQSQDISDVRILADNWSSDEEFVAPDKIEASSSKAGKAKTVRETVSETEETAPPTSFPDKLIECGSNDMDAGESSDEVPDLVMETKEDKNLVVAHEVTKEMPILNETKKALEIIINPGQKPDDDDDDIFADVFQNNLEKVDKKLKNPVAEEKSEEKKLEIIIDPGYKPDEDDIFADIFQMPSTKVKIEREDSTEKISKDQECISVTKNNGVLEKDLIVDKHFQGAAKIKEEPLDDFADHDIYQNELADSESDESSIANESPAASSSSASNILQPPPPPLSSFELNQMEVRKSTLLSSLTTKKESFYFYFLSIFFFQF